MSRTALHLACAMGNADAVRELLSWRASVNVGDNEAKTPLMKVQHIYRIYRLCVAVSRINS